MHKNEDAANAGTILGRRKFLRNTVGALLVPFVIGVGGQRAMAACPGSALVGAHI